MLRILRNKKAQNTAEYAILIGLVVAVAIAMQTYIKRGLQSGVKAKVDALTTTQYEPDYLESSYTATAKDYTNTEETKAGGEVGRVFGEKETTRGGYQKIGAPK